jgi:hypothetical protein
MTPCLSLFMIQAQCVHITFHLCVRSDVRLPLDTTIRIRQDRIFYILV